METVDFEKNLFVSESEKYGDKYIEHLIDQYKIYVNSAEKISDRRQKANEFFLTLNSGLVTLLGFISTKLEDEKLSYIVLLAPIAGMIMCYVWYRMIRSYKGLNAGKFKVIHAIEARLPLALYDTEWKVVGEGKDKRTYWPFSHIELVIPWIFIVIYATLFLLLIFAD